MNIHGIPKSLLTDSATILKRQYADAYGKDVFHPLEMTNIRLEKARSRIKNGDVNEEKSKIILYFDYNNSSPKALIFETLDMIKIHNVTYSIQLIEEKRAFNKIAYYKIHLKREGMYE